MGPGHVAAAWLAPFRHSSVCVFHTAQTFLLPRPQSRPSFTRRRSGSEIRIQASRNFSEGSFGILGSGTGTVFLSFRIYSAFQTLCLLEDCLKVQQKSEPPGWRRGVEKRRRSHNKGCLSRSRWTGAHVSAAGADEHDPLRSLPGLYPPLHRTDVAMAGVTRKGSGRPSYYYRFLGKSRLQRQRSRSRSRTRPATNRGKPSS